MPSSTRIGNMGMFFDLAYSNSSQNTYPEAEKHFSDITATISLAWFKQANISSGRTAL
jgi:hypothetical protein